MKRIFKAGIYEYERGWGSKLDEVREFDTAQERDTFIQNFNSQNTEDTVPDWYMVAQSLD